MNTMKPSRLTFQRDVKDTVQHIANTVSIKHAVGIACNYIDGEHDAHYQVPALKVHATWPWEWSFGYRVVQFDSKGMRAFYYG